MGMIGRQMRGEENLISWVVLARLRTHLRLLGHTTALQEGRLAARSWNGEGGNLFTMRYFCFFAAFIGTWWIVLVRMSYCVFFEMSTRRSPEGWW